MNGNNKTYAILVFGAPACGKTQFATKFGRKFNAPFINISQLRDEFKVDRKAALFIIKQIAKCKQNIVLEGGLDTEAERNEIRQIFQKYGYETVLIWIQTDVATLRRRLKAQLKSVEKAKATFEQRVNEIEAPSELEDNVVISGKHTFETQLVNVLANLSKK